jgi:tungstate transport system permease protein
MQDFGQAFHLAFALVFSADPDLMEIIGLSLRVSLTATLVAALIGLPLGAGLGVSHFPGRGAAVVLLNALMGLPPVVVGLLVYLMLSNAGPMGWLQLLYTPTAMIIAQSILITPIIAALSRQVVEDLHNEYAEQFRSLVGCPLQPADRRAGRFRPRGGRGRRGHHRRRQHQPSDPRHDDRHRARDL